MRVLGIAMGALLLTGTPAGAAPFRPTSDAEVVERLPASAVSRAAVKPGNPALAAALGRSYIERARRDGDSRFLGYAEAVLAPYGSRPDPPPEILLLHATLLQSRHRFDEALADLDRVLARAPGAAQAWLTRATILRVQGRYAEAAQACTGVADAAPFAARVCAAAVAGLAGGLAPAYKDLQALAVEAARRPAGERAWLAAERAEAAERLGRGADAEAIYRDALRALPGDWQLRAAFADFLLDAGRARDAADLLRGHERSDALLLRALLAQRGLGREHAALQARVADGFAAVRRRGEDPHLREEARYVLEVLGDAPRALELARRNWDVQREPWDARVLIAAADAAGQPRAADPVRAWIRATGFEDARIAGPRRRETR